jgi:glycosyltransferase involved in cell wall biosynthesis
MRVLHLSMLYPPHIIGGAEKSVALLCEAQQAAGLQVAACCTTPEGYQRDEHRGITVHRIPHGTSFWAEAWPQHNKLARLRRKALIPFSRSFEAGIGRVLDEFRPDIFHTHSMTDVSTRAWLAAAERGIPIVHTLRDYDLLCANSAMFHAGRTCTDRHLKCRLLTAAKRAHHEHVAAVVGVGQGILQTHLDHGYFAHVPPHLRRAIWNPAVLDGHIDDALKPAAGSPMVFGYIGRINVEKGVGTLLRACRRLPPGTWKLVVAGKAPTVDDPLYQEAEGLPVEFLGFVPAAQFFSKVDVLVVPSIWAEPLPRTILEAYAVGVPVIGSRAGGIPDLIGETNSQWLFEPDDTAGLQARMESVLAQGRDMFPPRSAFEEVLAKTTPEVVVKNYGQIYGAVISNK